MVSALDSGPSSVSVFRALAGDIVLCSWARHFTLTVPLSTQVHKWVPANLMLGVTRDGLASHQGASRNIPSRFMLLRPGKAPHPAHRDSRLELKGLLGPVSLME